MVFLEAGKLLMLPLVCLTAAVGATNFHDGVQITWGDDRAKILDGGRSLLLSLDKSSGSGFESKKEFLFGRFDVKLKLIPGDSAGTVTTYYLSSQGLNHDEIDFEFLGNASGEPYTVHTNVYADGLGNREMQYRLWFDPTLAHHLYSIVWNPQRIIFLVDDIPMREFGNRVADGVPFPNKKSMRLYSTLWNADDWATQGGRVKTNWSRAPFTADYSDLRMGGCVWSGQGSSSCMDSYKAVEGMWNAGIDESWRRRLMWVRRKFLIYNYCTDKARFPDGFPRECTFR